MKKVCLAALLAVSLLGLSCGRGSEEKEPKEIADTPCLAPYSSENPPQGFWLGQKFSYGGKLEAVPGEVSAETILYSKRSGCAIASNDPEDDKTVLRITTEPLVGAYTSNPFAVVQECLNAPGYKKKACYTDAQILVGKKFKTTTQVELDNKNYKLTVEGVYPKDFCDRTKDLFSELRLDGEYLGRSDVKKFAVACEKLT